MVEPVVTAVITGFISALGAFLAINSRVDRLDDKVDRRITALDEKFDRKFDALDGKFDAMRLDLVRHIERHPPDQAA